MLRVTWLRVKNILVYLVGEKVKKKRKENTVNKIYFFLCGWTKN